MYMAVVLKSDNWSPGHRATALFFFIAGIAPESIAQLYASKRMEAQGQFQMYYHTRPAYALGHLSMKMRLLYGAHAWTNQVVALMMPIWVAVPIIQIIFGVFPFNPNRSDKLCRHSCETGNMHNRAAEHKYAQCLSSSSSSISSCLGGSTGKRCVCMCERQACSFNAIAPSLCHHTGIRLIEKNS